MMKNGSKIRSQWRFNYTCWVSIFTMFTTNAFKGRSVTTTEIFLAFRKKEREGNQ